MRLCGYLARTKDVPLVLHASGLQDAPVGGLDMRVVGNSDADWAGCSTTLKSQTGWLVRFGGALVAWRAATQS